MTVIHTFVVNDVDGRPLEVSIVQMDDSQEFIVTGGDDLEQTSYSPALREAVRLAPMSLDDVLELAADVAGESTILQTL